MSDAMAAHLDLIESLHATLDRAKRKIQQLEVSDGQRLLHLRAVLEVVADRQGVTYTDATPNFQLMDALFGTSDVSGWDIWSQRVRQLAAARDAEESR